MEHKKLNEKLNLLFSHPGRYIWKSTEGYQIEYYKKRASQHSFLLTECNINPVTQLTRKIVIICQEISEMLLSAPPTFSFH